MLEKAQFWQRSAGTPMGARQIRVLNHVLDGMKGKLANAQWAAMGRCSADTALHNTNDLVARGVLCSLEEGGGIPNICGPNRATAHISTAYPAIVLAFCICGVYFRPRGQIPWQPGDRQLATPATRHASSGKKRSPHR